MWNLHLPKFADLTQMLLLFSDATTRAATSATGPSLTSPQRGRHQPFLGDGIAEAEATYGAAYRRLMGAPPAPPPPARPAAATCGVVLPDQFNNGGCDSGLPNSLARVQLALAQGCRVFTLDLSSRTPLENVDAIVRAIGAGGGEVIVGYHKDDSTLRTPGRPDLDRVPGNATAQALAQLGQRYKTSAFAHVALSTGGQPKNPDGRLDGEIAARLGVIVQAVRATGFTRNVYVPALGNYGQNLSYYASSDGQYFRQANVRFEITLSNSGDNAQVNATVQQCVKLPCIFRVGVQVDPTRAIFNSLGEVGRQIDLTQGSGQLVVLTPWAGEEIDSDGGEAPMLTGNACSQPQAALALSPTGTQLLLRQRQAATRAAALAG